MGISVVAFPLHRRRALVSDIVRLLKGQRDDAANLIWRSFAKELLRQLLASGVEA